MDSQTGTRTASLLAELQEAILRGDVEVVDLAQPLNERTPVIELPEPFVNTSPFRVTELSRYDERGPAWYWNDLSGGEHCGTHFDAPVHWVTGRDNDSVDAVPTRNLIGEACVIDVSQRCAEDPDYLLSVEDIEDFEQAHGRLPTHAWVLMRTGWGRYADDAERFFNVGPDGSPHTPGPSPAAARFLAEERRVLGMGVETVGTDAGLAATFDPPFPSHHFMHGANRYGLTQLANLDRLPPRGATIVVTPLPIAGGSGSPVRPIALVPAGSQT